MNRIVRPGILLALCFLLSRGIAWGQACTTPGQTPATAFPVCGTTTFQQVNVPICSTNDLFVPGCSGTGGADYENKNPFFYKFTCFVAGTLGFTITPAAANEDYDWQLYDITGLNPNEIFTNTSIIVTGNWSGSYGPTGASASGVNFIQCASSPGDNEPRFAKMPQLIAGHQYLLMVSHYSDTQSGYSLAFGGGTAVITDPALPHLQEAKADCGGQVITVKINKNILCNSLTAAGTEFTLSPAVSTITSAATTTCSPGFDFNLLTLTLSAPLPNGNFDLVIGNGSDGNTLKDYCDNTIPVGERVPFVYAAPQPIFADSIGTPKCAVDSVRVYFPKKIACSSIAADGSDFQVSGGPVPVTVSSAFGNCVNGKTEYVVVKFSSPIYTGGTYQLTLKAGNDGTVVIDECGQETPVQTLSFTTVDTVSAVFQYTENLGCRKDTFHFTHNGAHGVNSWQWTFNTTNVTTQNHTIIWPATSTNNVQLIVSNGVCRDTATQVIELANEVKASFTMDQFICPEDPLVVTNTSEGNVDNWFWRFDVVATSTQKDPQPVLFPTINREAYYTVKLTAFNNALGCRDSATKNLTVLDHCLIAVPTAFTPNNDGLNDIFKPHNALKADNYEFKVYNRWGQLVFVTKDWRMGWDGKLNGLQQGADVFVWMLSYIHRDTKKPVFQKGTVMLIR
jgi:gliding motility-associated-like protein